MDNFKEYMWYLLTSPFKRVKRTLNAWWIWCQVIGSMFDEAKEDFDRARDESMVATCSPEMLVIHGTDRQLTRYQGEDIENFRMRIAMYEEVCVLGGLKEGVLLAVKNLGFQQAEIIRAVDYTGNQERWAEFYLIVFIDSDETLPVSHDILKSQVRKVKASEALDNYVYLIQLHDIEVNSIEDCARIIIPNYTESEESVNERLVLQCQATTGINTAMHYNLKNNIWYWDGTVRMDGSRQLNAYETWEDL